MHHLVLIARLTIHNYWIYRSQVVSIIYIYICPLRANKIY